MPSTGLRVDAWGVTLLGIWLDLSFRFNRSESMPNTTSPSDSDSERRIIRELIRARLASGAIKPYYGMIVSAPIATDQTCAGCGLPIASAEATRSRHQYADGFQWFHVLCEVLWEDERKVRIHEDLRSP
jgi:hypothetical protein